VDIRALGELRRRKLIRAGEKVEVLKVSDVKDFKFWE
jgi:hypothetical protein